jgi:hypothetical protein
MKKMFAVIHDSYIGFPETEFSSKEAAIEWARKVAPGVGFSVYVGIEIVYQKSA